MSIVEHQKENFMLILKSIRDTGLRNFACDFFAQEVPNYFWTMPASATGKHHPAFANGEGGLVRHTIIVCDMAKALSTRGNYRSVDADSLLCACLMHDTFKFGELSDTPTASATVGHASVAADRIYHFYQNWPGHNGVLNQEIYDICYAVAMHMGQWSGFTSLAMGNGDSGSARQKLAEILQISDLLSSQKFLDNLADF